jgi:hypothetical protein
MTVRPDYLTIRPKIRAGCAMGAFPEALRLIAFDGDASFSTPRFAATTQA